MLAHNKTYLYTEWTIELYGGPEPDHSRASAPRTGRPVRSRRRSRFPVQQSGELPAMDPGQALPTTHAAARKLVYKFGDDVLLETPARGYATDAANGPIVEECTVIQCMGIVSFIVHMRISLLNECNRKNPLLSHTWKRWVEYDQDYLGVVTTDGKAVFRPRHARRPGRLAGPVPPRLMHPIPLGFSAEQSW